MIILILSCF